MAPGPNRLLGETESTDLIRAANAMKSALADMFDVPVEDVYTKDGEVVFGVTTADGTPLGVSVNITP